MRRLKETKGRLLLLLKKDRTLADNYRKLYVELLAEEGYVFSPDVFIRQIGVSESTVNRGLEKLLKELANPDRCLAYGFSMNDYEYFYRLKLKGRRAKDEIHRAELSNAIGNDLEKHFELL